MTYPVFNEEIEITKRLIKSKLFTLKGLYMYALFPLSMRVVLSILITVVGCSSLIMNTATVVGKQTLGNFFACIVWNTYCTFGCTYCSTDGFLKSTNMICCRIGKSQ